jgi:hypothetical protein
LGVRRDGPLRVAGAAARRLRAAPEAQLSLQALDLAQKVADQPCGPAIQPVMAPVMFEPEQLE